MGQYFRVGNQTVTFEELKTLRPQDIKKIEDDAEIANEKRLENIRQGLGIKQPQNITLDVTPAGIAARKAAIEAEEARIAAETKAVDLELGTAGGFLNEGEQPETPAKKTKEQKAEERRIKAEEKKQKAEAAA